MRLIKNHTTNTNVVAKCLFCGLNLNENERFFCCRLCHTDWVGRVFDTPLMTAVREGPAPTAEQMKAFRRRLKLEAQL